MTAKKIYPRYIHEMYYYLLAMNDDEINDFNINDQDCRAKLFDSMKVDFDTFGPLSKERVLEAIQFILSSGQINELWGYVVPGAVPLNEVEDRFTYLCELYEKLTGSAPPLTQLSFEGELVTSAGPHGLDVRL